MTINTDVPVAISTDAQVAAAQEDEETSAADLVLPLAVVGAAGVLAGYGYLRRTRRARTRTTPGGSTHPAPPSAPLTGLDEQSRTLLAEADDRIRAGREELSFAGPRAGSAAVAPLSRAVREAEAELSAAFRIRHRYDAGVPEDEPSRRHALTGIVGRCQEAARRLDREAAAFDRLRGPALESGEALAFAETRFRELAARTATSETTLTDVTRHYAPSATAPVTGYVEQAKDHLVFATTHLNRSRQAADSGDRDRTAGDLRAAEGAIARAAVLLDRVERLAADLTTAREMLAATLTGAEAELAVVRAMPATGKQGPSNGPLSHVPVGELRARLRHADAVLASVRQTLTGARPYDPLDLLRRIVEAAAPLATGRGGVLPAAALLTAHHAIADADAFIAVHRAAVGAEARTLLAAARDTAPTGPAAPPSTLMDRLHADTLARRARELAEQDVRLRGNPHTDTAPPAGFGGPGSRAHRDSPTS
ncbi:hypothetical protein [Streptomyces sp. NPDC058678]|uniref:hypothetical protein n=1 Tax=Streptomyces sp. NPDC058678 TaxID=3346595 RepID=UPI00364BD199